MSETNKLFTDTIYAHFLPQTYFTHNGNEQSIDHIIKQLDKTET